MGARGVDSREASETTEAARRLKQLGIMELTTVTSRQAIRVMVSSGTRHCQALGARPGSPIPISFGQEECRVLLLRFSLKLLAARYDSRQCNENLST